MAVTVYATPLLEAALSPSDLDFLKRIFANYIETDEQPYLFGVDRPYDEPPRAKVEGLRHIHLYEEQSPQWSRDRTSDSALVYCQGWHDPEAFLLIALLKPNAHITARNLSRMRLYCDWAERFRLKN